MTISPREPKFIIILADSIPIEISLGPLSSSPLTCEDLLEDDNLLNFVEFESVSIRGLNFAKSSKDETPRIFSLKYLKLNQLGKMSN